MSTPTLADFLDEAALAALARPTAEATGLPGRAYGEDFYRLEQRQLFPRTWAAVGFGAQVPEPGDACPVDLAGWPLVMMRGEDGELRVFHNVCRHRGMRVLAEPASKLHALRCPWHGWTYGLDGTLRATPNLGGEGVGEAPGFRKEGIALAPVRSGRWLDYVLVNLDGKAPPLDQHLAPLEAMIAGRDHTDLRHAGRWEGRYPGNWKTAVEGGIEDYHLPWGHPELVRGVVTRNPETHLGGACCSAVSGRIEYRQDARANAPALRAGALPAIPTAPPADPGRSYIANLFPTGIMAILPDHVMLGLFTPDGPAATRLEFSFYVQGDAASDPALAEMRRAMVDAWAFVAGQDTPFVKGVQSNHALRDNAGIGTRFSPFWEGAVHHFQKTVAATIRGAAIT